MAYKFSRKLSYMGHLGMDIYESSGCTIPLFYDAIKNIFYEEDGYEVYDLFSYITPNELLLFRSRREDVVVENPELEKYILLYYTTPDWWGAVNLTGE